MTNAESMYVLGNESWVTIEFNLPSEIDSVAINDNQDLVFSYYGSSGYSNVVFFSTKFNLSNGVAYPCDEEPASCGIPLTAGVNKIKIKSEGTYVNISKVS